VDSNVLVDKEMVELNKNERSPVFSGLQIQKKPVSLKFFF